MYKIIYPKNQIRDEIGSDAYHGALTDEISGGLHASKYVYGLATTVSNLEAQICEHTDVIDIDRNDSNYFRLITSKGDVRAKKVIIATNGYTDRLMPRLKPLIFPVGSYIVVTEPLSEDLQNIISPKKRMYYDSKWFLNYFRLTPDGRMLWGGRNDLSTDLDLDDSAKRLTMSFILFFQILEIFQLHTPGQVNLGITFDLMPHIGEKNGIYYAFGYGGHGLSIATYLGTEIGLLLSGKKDRSPFMDISHQTMFFYRNKTNLGLFLLLQDIFVFLTGFPKVGRSYIKFRLRNHYISYMMGMVGVGFGSQERHGDFEDFFLAGRSLTTPLLNTTLISTYYGLMFFLVILNWHLLMVLLLGLDMPDQHMHFF